MEAETHHAVLACCILFSIDHPGDVLSSWIYETNHEIFSSLEKGSVRFVNEPEDKNEQFTIAPGHGEWITAMVDKKTCSVCQPVVGKDADGVFSVACRCS